MIKQKHADVQQKRCTRSDGPLHVMHGRGTCAHDSRSRLADDLRIRHDFRRPHQRPGSRTTTTTKRHQLGRRSTMRRQQLRPLGSASNTKRSHELPLSCPSTWRVTNELSVCIKPRNKLSDYIRLSSKPTCAWATNQSATAYSARRRVIRPRPLMSHPQLKRHTTGPCCLDD